MVGGRTVLGSRLTVIDAHSSIEIMAARGYSFFFFFNHAATPEIYPLSLHEALPICSTGSISKAIRSLPPATSSPGFAPSAERRSEEHTSELQSRLHLLFRLLFE